MSSFQADWAIDCHDNLLKIYHFKAYFLENCLKEESHSEVALIID